MDELDENANSRCRPSSAELTMPVDGESNRPISEDVPSQSDEISVMTETASAISIPPTIVATNSSLSFLERYWKLALIVILVLAIALRTRGLNWDEGEHLHPDERFLTMVETAIRLPNSLGQYFDTTH